MMKYVLYQFEKGKGFYAFAILQMIFVFLVVIACSSVYSYNYQYYNGFKEYLEKDGLYLEVRYIELDESKGICTDSKEIGGVLKNADVLSCYSPAITIENSLDDQEYYELAYDDKIMSLYRPEIRRGTWFTKAQNMTDEGCLNAVISDNSSDLDVGDILEGRTFSGYPLKIKIIGILAPDASILGHTPGEADSGNDCTRMYTDFGSKDERRITLIFNQAEIIQMSEKMGREARLDSSVSDIVLVSFHDNISAEEIEYNRELIDAQDGINYILDMKEFNKNSLRNFNKKTKYLFPLMQILVVFVSINILGITMIMARKQSALFSVYNICGLSRKRYMMVSFWCVFISIVLAAIVSIMVVRILILYRNLYENAFILTHREIIACVIVSVFYVAFTVLSLKLSKRYV